MVTHLFVDPHRIPMSVRLFRIDGWPVALIVSSVVKDVMVATGCEGAKFEEVT